MKQALALFMASILCAACLSLVACGGSGSTSIKDTRELSWSGTELTVKVGTNKSTGCEWKTKFENDKIIDYSVNRVFHLSDESLLKGQSYGISDIGYKGKSEGTAKIFMTTEKDWEGNTPGYSYTITVMVGPGGVIQNAVGE